MHYTFVNYKIEFRQWSAFCTRKRDSLRIIHLRPRCFIVSVMWGGRESASPSPVFPSPHWHSSPSLIRSFIFLKVRVRNTEFRRTECRHSILKNPRYSRKIGPSRSLSRFFRYFGAFPYNQPKEKLVGSFHREATTISLRSFVVQDYLLCLAFLSLP